LDDGHQKTVIASWIGSIAGQGLRVKLFLEQNASEWIPLLLESEEA
jgi:hypothetical protein